MPYWRKSAPIARSKDHGVRTFACSHRKLPEPSWSFSDTSSNASSLCTMLRPALALVVGLSGSRARRCIVLESSILLWSAGGTDRAAISKRFRSETSAPSRMK
eukprot:5475423-Amphidinium_carterae.1